MAAPRRPHKFEVHFLLPLQNQCLLNPGRYKSRSLEEFRTMFTTKSRNVHLDQIASFPFTCRLLLITNATQILIVSSEIYQ